MSYIKRDLQYNQYALFLVQRIRNNTSNSYTDLYIPVQFFNGQMASTIFTYDESISLKDNQQGTLSFTVPKIINNTINPIFSLITENRKLRLQAYNNIIDFIITKITPEWYNNNLLYKVTCQDACSYVLSKNNISITYESEFPETISTMTRNILSIAKMNDKWIVDPTLETDYYADFPSFQKLAEQDYDTTERMTATVKISNTTVYNALMEVCKLFNASLSVKYPMLDEQANILFFTNKAITHNSGYSLKPNINLNNFSLSYDSSHLCNLLRVDGAEDGDGNSIFITPAIPLPLQNYFLMLYPHKINKATVTSGELNSMTNYPYIVTNYKDNYTLYYRDPTIQATAFIKLNDDYEPWTLKTSEKIEEDFYNFPNSNDPYFVNINFTEIENYFNFLKYRVKSAGNFFYDFSYFEESGLLDKNSREDLENIFTIQLRNANIMHFCLIRQKNIIQQMVDSANNNAAMSISQIAALNEQEFNNVDTDKVQSRTINNNILDLTTNIKKNIWNETFFNNLLLLENYKTSKEYDSEAVRNPFDEFDESTPSANYSFVNDIYKNKNKACDSFLKIQNTQTAILNTAAAPGYCRFVVSNDPLWQKQQYTLSLESNIFDKIWVYYDFLLKQYKIFFIQGAEEYSLQGEDLVYTVSSSATDASADGVSTSFTGVSGITDTNNKITELTVEFNIVVEGVVKHITLKYTSAQGSSFIHETQPAWNRYDYTLTNNNFQKAIVYYTSQDKKVDIYFTIDSIRYKLDSQGMVTYTLQEKNEANLVNFSITPNPKSILEHLPTDNNKIVIQCNLSSNSSLIITYTCLTTVEERLQELRKNFAAFSQYSALEKQRKILLDKISVNGGVLVYKGQFLHIDNRNGYYAVWLSLFKECLDSFHGSIIPESITESLATIDKQTNKIWKNLYESYGDFIIEGVFNDTNQRSTEGLFMSALNAFSKNSRPAVQYSATIIADNLIDSELATDVKINDIVKIEDINLSSEYNGFLEVKIPNRQIPPGAEIEFVNSIMYEDEPRYYTTNSEEAIGPWYNEKRQFFEIYNYHIDNDCMTLFIKVDKTTADLVYLNKGNINAIKYSIYRKDASTTKAVECPIIVPIIDLQLGQRVKPIPLQVTGITRKLRDGTTQLTVSTDRTMDIIFSRLVKQARL